MKQKYITIRRLNFPKCLTTIFNYKIGPLEFNFPGFLKTQIIAKKSYYKFIDNKKKYNPAKLERLWKYFKVISNIIFYVLFKMQ